MRSLTKILLPVDFSERSLGAARYARLLAGHFQSELTLLHVLMPPQYEFGALEANGAMLNELYQSRAAQVDNELQTFLADELADCGVRRVALEGDPAQGIVAYAHSEGMGLIVMPTHGYGHFRQFILGSITAKVLHDANCPVWTGVHMQEAPAGELALRHIACALDLGPQSAGTLQWAAGLSREFGARLSVLHVATCGGMESRIRQEIASLEQQAGTQAEVVVQSGDPPNVVCAEAARIGADLLVIARGSAAGHYGRLRTNAYAIIRQSPCPVVSV